METQEAAASSGDGAMARYQITSGSGDPLEATRNLKRLRRELYSGSALCGDLESPAFEIRRGDNGIPLFEAVVYREPFQQVIEHARYDSFNYQPATGPVGEPCLRCGYIAGGPTLAVCPSCGFREVSACPYCRRDVPRWRYVPTAGDAFRCPECGKEVFLRFNDSLTDADGEYNEPVVLVEPGRHGWLSR
jgi:predicted RNA-binding Zn-ribbon protein involved in translation (DUF1610 family)